MSFLDIFKRNKDKNSFTLPPVYRNEDDLLNGQIQAIDLSGLLGRNTSKFQSVMTSEQAYKHYFRWQYAAACAIAEAVMMTGFDIQEKKGDEWESNSEHPVKGLLKRINFFMTGAEFFYWVVTDCVMVGKSYWRVAFNSINEPGELWPIMGTMAPELEEGNANNPIVRWKNEYQGKKGLVTDYLEPREVVYLRIPFPGKLWDGFGSAQAAGAPINVDDQILESVYNTFKQGVFPSALVKLGGELDKKKRKKVMEEFNDRFAGARNTGAAIGISKAMEIVWPPIKNELVQTKASEIMRDNILGTMRVPPAILGLSKDVNRASAEALEYIFAKWRIKPTLFLLQERLQQDLIAPYWDGTRLVFDDVVPADKEAQRENINMKMKNQVYSINEVRAMEGLQPQPWGDKPFIEAGRVPIDEAGSVGEGQAQDAPFPGSPEEAVVASVFKEAEEIDIQDVPSSDDTILQTICKGNTPLLSEVGTENLKGV